MQTKKCKHCQSEIDKKAKVCPVCRKKQGGKLKFVIIAIIVIIVLGALLNGGDDEPQLVEDNKKETIDKNNTNDKNDTNDTNDTSGETQPTATPTPEKTSFSVGETAKLKDIHATLVNVSESEGSEFNTPEDGNVFVLAEFEIENNSDEEISVSSMMSFEAYSDNYSISQSLSALIEKGEKNQLDGTIAAGKKMNGVIGYEVSKDWSELEIHFTPDFWSDNDIVFIANK